MVQINASLEAISSRAKCLGDKNHMLCFRIELRDGVRDRWWGESLQCGGSMMDNLGAISSCCILAEGSRCGAQPPRVSWITGTPPPVIKVQHKRRRNHVKMMIPPVISLSSSPLIPLFITSACVIHSPLYSSSPSSHTPSLVVV